jgi:site-specific DNA-methyltransferase (adenine-specific)
MRWCLENYAKDSQLIIDPFGGSGTTARACKDMGKDFIIIDKEEKYCEIMEKRLEQEVLF